MWWKTAYGKYSDLSRAMGIAADPESEILSNTDQSFRPVTSLAVGTVSVALGDDFEHLKMMMRAGDRISTLIPGTNLERIDFSSQGIGVIGADEVLAFVLHGVNAPAITLKEMGVGAKISALSIGMSSRDLDLLMKDADYDYRELVDPEVKYRFYKNLGLALLIQNATVTEIIISQIPKRTRDFL